MRATAESLLVLVKSCVRPYQGSPESTEDLMQVGYVGLLKAINNFDPASPLTWPANPSRWVMRAARRARRRAVYGG